MIEIALMVTAAFVGGALIAVPCDDFVESACLALGIWCIVFSSMFWTGVF